MGGFFSCPKCPACPACPEPACPECVSCIGQTATGLWGTKDRSVRVSDFGDEIFFTHALVGRDRQAHKGIDFVSKRVPTIQLADGWITGDKRSKYTRSTDQLFLDGGNTPLERVESFMLGGEGGIDLSQCCVLIIILIAFIYMMQRKK